MLNEFNGKYGCLKNKILFCNDYLNEKKVNLSIFFHSHAKTFSYTFT